MYASTHFAWPSVSSSSATCLPEQGVSRLRGAQLQICGSASHRRAWKQTPAPWCFRSEEHCTRRAAACDGLHVRHHRVTEGICVKHECFNESQSIRRFACTYTPLHRPVQQFSIHRPHRPHRAARSRFPQRPRKTLPPCVRRRSLSLRVRRG